MKKNIYTLFEAKKKLADFCSYQDRCQYEVTKKLNDFYFLSEEEKNEIIIYLIQHNFLSEERFSNSYTRGKFYQKKWGKNKIKKGLIQRQIPLNLIISSFNEIDPNDYKKTIKLLAEKKLVQTKEENIFLKKKKLINYLSQKGFEYEFIFEVIEEITG